jgi:hypothetical protein
MGLLDGLLQGLSGGQGGSGGEGIQQALFEMLGQGGTDGLTGLAQNFQSQRLGDALRKEVRGASAARALVDTRRERKGGT